MRQLTDALKARGMSRSDLARAVGVTQPMVYQWLSGRRPIAAERVLAIEAATGISRHDLRPDIYPREKRA